MKYFEILLTYLSPTLLIPRSDWVYEWKKKEKKYFNANAKIALIASGFIWFMHIFLFDIPMKLQPEELWLKLRVSISTMLILTALLTNYLHKNESKFLKIPFIISTFTLCFFQNKTLEWYPQNQFLYSYLFTFVCVVLLRENLINTFIFSSIFLLSHVSVQLNHGLEPSVIISASTATVLFTLFMRSKSYDDVMFFLESKKTIELQTKLIESEMEIQEQLRAFLPKEIHLRIEKFKNKNKNSLINVVDEVLRAKQKDIFCLFTDIRGFTESSKDIAGKLSKDILPALQNATIISEKNYGIPKLVGDLVFTYFDSNNFQENFDNSINTALDIAEWDLVNKFPLKRHYLLSHGQALVGNIGGVDSAREITALGTPVNFLSRLDEITKDAALSNVLGSNSLIVSEDFYKLFSKNIQEFFEEYTLEKIKIRNFENLKNIYFISLNQEKIKKIKQILSKSINYYHQMEVA